MLLNSLQATRQVPLSRQTAHSTWIFCSSSFHWYTPAGQTIVHCLRSHFRQASGSLIRICGILNCGWFAESLSFIAFLVAASHVPARLLRSADAAGSELSL